MRPAQRPTPKSSMMSLAARERVWLAQESRPLPGAEFVLGVGAGVDVVGQEHRTAELVLEHAGELDVAPAQVG